MFFPRTAPVNRWVFRARRNEYKIDASVTVYGRLFQYSTPWRQRYCAVRLANYDAILCRWGIANFSYGPSRPTILLLKRVSQYFLQYLTRWIFNLYGNIALSYGCMLVMSNIVRHNYKVNHNTLKTNHINSYNVINVTLTHRYSYFTSCY